MKIYVWYVFIWCILGSIRLPLWVHASTVPAWAKSCEQRTFKVTAYYSPQEWQYYYVKWSLEKDKILNGDGTHGASWKPVFNGMIAAPSSYPFGTRIYIPGWGIWQVEDRGGAIVASGEKEEQYDRLDIRAGTAQEWLDNAMFFWVRFLEAYVCPSQVWGEVIGFDFTTLPEGLFPVRSLWDISLQPGKISKRVPILQTYLMKLGYLVQQATSLEFDDLTTYAVCTYQMRIMWLAKNNQRCGWFGPQTRASMKAHVQKVAVTVADAEEPVATPTITNEMEESSDPVSSVPWVQTTLSWEWLFGLGWEFATYTFGNVFSVWDIHHEIKILQRKLQRLWYYPLEKPITGIYDEATIRAVFIFQLAEGILERTGDPQLFGYFWPRTRAKLNEI